MVLLLLFVWVGFVWLFCFGCFGGCGVMGCFGIGLDCVVWNFVFFGGLVFWVG